MTRGARIRAVVLVGAGLLVGFTGAGAAHAEPPPALAGQINDVNGTLAAGQAPLRSALVALDTEDAIRLYVVAVTSTDGVDTQAYADGLADAEGLGTDQPLLVLVTGQPQDYTLSVTADFPLTDAQLRQVTDAAEGPFSAGDYAGAAIAVSDRLRVLVDDAGWSFATVAPAAGVAVLVGAGGALLLARRRRRQAVPDGQAGPSLADLNADSSRLLVGADEDLRGAERELAFAHAEFGDQPVAGYAQALAQAKAMVVGAFSIRQQLDDAYPEDEATQRAMLSEIVERCTQAREVLATQAADFAALRDIASRAGELIPALRRRVAAAEQALPRAAAHLDELRAGFAASALVAVEDTPRQVRERILAATDNLRTAEAKTAAGRRPEPEPVADPQAPARVQAAQASGSTAFAIRSAEEALTQAENLLSTLDRVAGEIRQAQAQLPQAQAALTADLAGCATLPAQPALDVAVQAAQDALRYAAEHGHRDPVAALTRVAQADAALDQATAGARELADRQARASAALPQALAAAQAAVDVAQDTITVNRDYIGGTARTRLSEAVQALSQAHALAGSDPSAALGLTSRATDLAQAALIQARADLDAASAPPTGGSWGGGPSWGTGTSWGSGGVLGSVFGDGWSTGGSWGGMPRGGGWSGGGGGRTGGGSVGSSGRRGSRRR